MSLKRKNIGLIIIVLFFFVSLALTGCENNTNLRNRNFRIGSDFPVGVFVYSSSEQDAEDYYTRISAELGFNAGSQDDTLDNLLKYYGYEGLTGKDIEGIASDILMPTDSDGFSRLINAVNEISPDSIFSDRFTLSDFTNEKVLATRFFAPKISDSSLVSNPRGENRTFGWRKLVRLRPRANSQAEEKGLESLHLLFNVFSKAQNDPFDPQSNPSARSINNQAMLVRGENSNLNDSVYWLVYERSDIGGGKTLPYLEATFDAPGTPTYPPQGRYFLPGACAQCHGVKRAELRNIPTNPSPNGKLNYLDTDHWFDKAEAQNDFSEIGDSLNGVLYDGGKDKKSPEFSRAFDIIRTINSEILSQNLPPVSSSNAFQVRAVTKWLELHANSNNRHFPPIERSLPPEIAGGTVWTQGNQLDEELLPKLNQFCFRCHSSLEFHVFDKEAVKSKVPTMIGFIQNPPFPNAGIMPQDRKLEENTRQEIVDLLEQL